MSATASRTFAEERRAAIMDMLERTSSVQVADIAETFGVSSVTARADLAPWPARASCAEPTAAPSRFTRG